MRQELLKLKSFDWNDEKCLLTLMNGRLNKKSNGELETVKEAIDRVCETAAYYTKNPSLYERKFKEYSYLNMLNFSTPVWANMGFDNPNSPVACYVMGVEDNTYSITSAVPEMAALAKYGGGLGIHMNDIRGFGSPISSGGVSNGVLPWVDLYATTIDKVSQGGVRRGNGALYLDIDHPDFYDFLKFRRTNDEIDLGINITDDFIERCDKGDKEARKRYEALLKERVEQGEPYIVFIDRMNRAKPQIYKDLGLKINGSNLCVHGDTLVLTDKGNIKIKDHVGQKVNVWNGEEYSETIIQKTGENQKLLKVTIDLGKENVELLCTPYHKFYLYDGTTVNDTLSLEISLKEVRAKDLKIGDATFSCPEDNKEAKIYCKIKSIEEVEGLHDTYCFNEPKKHMGVFNGILTGQCSEISLHTSSKYTGVCVLSSQNLSLYDLWKGSDLPEVSTVFLNAVNDHFIDKMEGVSGFEKAVAYAKRFRSLGLGVLGWQSYLQKNMIPFESYEAMRLNNQIFKEIKEGALKGADRNAHLLAIAPTRSNAIIANSSRSIEPWTANIHIRKENKSKFVVKNNELDRLIKIKYNENYDQIWKDIELNNGSVQGLKWFTEEEQKVFKTFAEIDQKVIIMQAEQRAKYICQSASVDLRFPANATAKYIHDVHWYATKECKYIKSLYYCNSSATIKAGLNTKECAACEG